MKPEKIVSAQVVFVAESGARPGPEAKITSANIHDWLPARDSVERVTARLRALGFEVGAPVGNSASITGPVRLFEGIFRTKLTSVTGSVRFTGGYSLPTSKVPADLRSHVAAITFTPAPDFGPGSTLS